MLRKVIYFVLILTVTFSYAFGQKNSKEDTVYTFPFHMESRLIVFEGKLNGKQANFVFDTGAALGLAGKSFANDGRIEVKGKRMTIRDSNNNTKKVRTGYTDVMNIGGMRITNPKVLVTEMPYLSCQNYYLLGSNVIKLINWVIDFDKMEISVSLQPFDVPEDYLALEIKYENSRPFTTVSFGGIKLSKVLIDTGYTRILDIDNGSNLVQAYLANKESIGRVNKNISLSTGAISQTMDETTVILVDTLDLAGYEIYDIPIDFFETTSTKLGIGFFKAISHKTIINNSDSKYYLNLRSQSEFKDPFLLNLQYSKGEVIVSGKSLEDDQDFKRIEIGEEVVTINGQPTSRFSDECDFVQWYFTYNEKTMTIETKDGDSFTFGKSKLK